MRQFLTILYGLYFLAQAQQAVQYEAIFQLKALASSFIGISVKEVNSQEIIYEKNSHWQFVPASTFKLLISFIGLEKLGKDFRFKTAVYIRGEIKNKNLEGDVIIKGYGDPTIESRFFKSSVLQDICDVLKKKGIEKISGKLIVDNSYFHPKINDHWVWEDVNNYYSAIPYPVNIYDNEFHIYFQSANSGDTVKILKIIPQYTKPPLIEITKNEVVAQAGGDNAYIYGDPIGYQKRIEGSLPAHQKEYSIEGALPDPPRMFADVLIHKLFLNNIELQNKTAVILNKDSFNYSNSYFLGDIYSVPLSEVVSLTNLHSINLFAEAIMWALGKGNYDKGKKEIISYLKQYAINDKEINIDDACGLSRLNGISADVLTALLSKFYIKNKEWAFTILPVAGESGTMKKFSDTAPLKGHLMCKTGYIERVRTYAGYLKVKSGKVLAVSVMYNNFNVSSEKIKQISKTFFETLYQNY